MSTPACIAATPRNGSERTPKLLVKFRLATGWIDGIEIAVGSGASSCFQLWNSARYWASLAVVVVAVAAAPVTAASALVAAASNGPPAAAGWVVWAAAEPQAAIPIAEARMAEKGARVRRPETVEKIIDPRNHPAGCPEHSGETSIDVESWSPLRFKTPL